MEEFVVEVGHPNGAFYKVKRSFCRRLSLRSFPLRRPFTMSINSESMSNTIKSECRDETLPTTTPSPLRCRCFPPCKVPFAENRLRLPPESNDLKKLSPNDPCEVRTADPFIARRMFPPVVQRFSPNRKKTNRSAGGRRQRECSRAISLLSIIKAMLKGQFRGKASCPVIKSVVQIQSNISSFS